MDIAAASIDLAQNKVADQVGTAMLSKGLKAAEDQAAELVKMMGSPAPLPSDSGQRIDLLA